MFEKSLIDITADKMYANQRNFAAMDLNGDGYISRAEYEASVGGVNPSSPSGGGQSVYHQTAGQLVYDDIMNNRRAACVRRLKDIPKNRPLDVLTFRDSYGNTCVSLALQKGWHDVSKALNLFDTRNSVHRPPVTPFLSPQFMDPENFVSSYQFVLDVNLAKRKKIWSSNRVDSSLGEVIHDDIYHNRRDIALQHILQVDIRNPEDILRYKDSRGYGSLDIALSFLESDYKWIDVVNALSVFDPNAPVPIYMIKDPKKGKEKEIKVVKGAPKVTVVTGSKSGAGTDANVTLTIYGTRGDSGAQALKNSETFPNNPFEKGHADVFTLKPLAIGDVTKIKIGHDNKNGGAAWFLESVKIEISGKVYMFQCSCWLDAAQGDKKIVREFFISGELAYKVTTTTGQKLGSGTDANVFVMFKGSRGDSGVLTLSQNEKRSDPFEKGQTDVFHVKGKDCGDLTAVVVGHDGAGRLPDWLCVRISVEYNRRIFSFDCLSWLGKTHGLVKEFLVNPEHQYSVTTQTGSKVGAGTDANVYIMMKGERGSLDRKLLSNSMQYKDPFENGHADTFTFAGADIGPLTAITIGHDGRGISSGWFLDNVIIEHGNKKYNFQCGRWLATNEDDFLIERTLTLSKSKMLKINVHTGKVSGAGTDANVYLVVHGSLRTSDKFFLRKSISYTNKFEKGHVDVFEDSMPDVGRITSIDIGHDNAGGGSAWFLDKVHIDVDGLDHAFICNQWLDASQGDRKIQRNLPLFVGTKYHIVVTTGSKMGAGTDAKVYVNINGAHGKSTGTLNLAQGNNMNPFERNQVDVFDVFGPDVGKIESLTIGHDDGKLHSAWFLGEVSIDVNGVSYVFESHQWFDNAVGDRKIERLLLPNGDHAYNVSVQTGDVFGAGTDANVYIQFLGMSSCFCLYFFLFVEHLHFIIVLPFLANFFCVSTAVFFPPFIVYTVITSMFVCMYMFPIYIL